MELVSVNLTDTARGQGKVSMHSKYVTTEQLTYDKNATFPLKKLHSVHLTFISQHSIRMHAKR